MSGKQYLRCACPKCGAVITYPDYSAGGMSVCTRCANSLRLPAALKTNAPSPAQPAAKPKPSAATTPAPVAPVNKPLAPPASGKPPPPPARTTVRPVPDRDTVPRARGRSGLPRFALWILNLAVVAAVALVLFNRNRDQSAPEAAPGDPGSNVTATPAPIPLPGVPAGAPAAVVPPPTASTKPAPASTPSPTAPVPATAPIPAPTVGMMTTNTPVPTGVPPATGPKLLRDLRVSGLTIEQPKGTKGSKLVYVTGLLQNDSAQQRFGVRINLDLLDAAGAKVDMTTDYTAVIEPRATWRFRALVLDRRAVGARVAGIAEEP